MAIVAAQSDIQYVMSNIIIDIYCIFPSTKFHKSQHDEPLNATGF